MDLLINQHELLLLVSLVAVIFLNIRKERRFKVKESKLCLNQKRQFSEFTTNPLYLYS